MLVRISWIKYVTGYLSAFCWLFIAFKLLHVSILRPLSGGRVVRSVWTRTVLQSFCFHGTTGPPPSWPMPPHYRGFMITLRHTTVSRTSLDEWSARRTDLYLTTHNTHDRQQSMLPVGFEPAVPISERPQPHTLHRAATGIDTTNIGSCKLLPHVTQAYLAVVFWSKHVARACNEWHITCVCVLW
jgi:hypothetical protein